MVSFTLELCFLIFTCIFLLYSVFFEQEIDDKEYKYADVVICVSMFIYTCFFLYFTDFSVLEILALVILVLSYPVSYFYSKNNYPKIKIGNKN